MGSPEKSQIQLKVVGEDPVQAQAPLFRVVAVVWGKEVQIEFIFLDLNHVAAQMQNLKAAPPSEPTLFKERPFPKSWFLRGHSSN